MGLFDRFPIRWRLALTSATLTFLILLVLASAVGGFATRDLWTSFDADIAATAADIQSGIDIEPIGPTALQLRRPSERTLRVAVAGGAVLRIVDLRGHVVYQTANGPALGRLRKGTTSRGRYRIVTRPLLLNGKATVAFLQYARPAERVEHSVHVVWWLLVLSVLLGTVLALLAGVAVARRAMGPVIELTRTARQIAQTRDASLAIPEPETDDEIGELAVTLGEMLGELDSARVDVEMALARQRQFVGDASHELRTPLTSVFANLEILEPGLDGEDLETVQSALRSCRRMRLLVNDLLLLASSEDTAKRTARSNIDLNSAVRAALGEVAPLVQSHRLDADLSSALVVSANPEQVQRLVINLVTNALVHTPAGTLVTVRTMRSHDAAWVVVEDDGPGVDPALADVVFDRFVRGGGDHGQGGTGLGLAIVKAIAREHGGDVTLETHAGGGSRFLVRLPLSGDRVPTA
jgi:two-component system OmpR family sensor kinase